MSTDRKALVIGATGLVGGFLLDELLKNKCFKQVIVLARRRIEREHPKLIQILTDFSESDLIKHNLSCTDFFSCLGTTIKQAASKIKFRNVDYQIPFSVAQLVKQQGCEHSYIVSSIGANAQSSNFYLRTKGELENAINTLNFLSSYIFQPGFLVGKRKESRLLEDLSYPLVKLITPLLIGKNKKYRPIEAEKVAKAMVKCASKIEKGVHYVTYPDFEELTTKFVKLEI